MQVFTSSIFGDGISHIVITKLKSAIMRSERIFAIIRRKALGRYMGQRNQQVPTLLIKLDTEKKNHVYQLVTTEIDEAIKSRTINTNNIEAIREYGNRMMQVLLKMQHFALANTAES